MRFVMQNPWLTCNGQWQGQLNKNERAPEEQRAGPT